MKLQKINDKQIRCTLENQDLLERGINLMELAYGSEKAQKLFKEMLQSARKLFDFDASDTPIMVEATPILNEGLVLIITKVDDPDELDTRFSKFSPSIDDEIKTLLEGVKNHNDSSMLDFEHFDDSFAFDENNKYPLALDNNIENNQKQEFSTEQLPISGPKAFAFENIDILIEACKHLSPLHIAPSFLYKNPKNNIYYLVLLNENIDNALFISSCNILSEYSKRISFLSTSKAYFDEHFELIIKDFALNKLSKI